MHRRHHVEGQLATALNARLEAKDWSVLHLTNTLGATYEHIRKIALGLAFPSKHLLVEICHVLDLDPRQMHKLMVADKIEKKFGTIPLELAGKTPRFARLERVLPHLSDEQFSSLMAIAEDMARRNLSQQKPAKVRRH
jgi:hypothetical protein